MISLVIPIYKNELNIPDLLDALEGLNSNIKNELEVVFSVDGSPDRSFDLLKEKLVHSKFKSKLILLSRNFGAFAAVKAGLTQGTGPYFAVMAADLQEPVSLIETFYNELKTNTIDVIVAGRETRVDSLRVKFFSKIAWTIYQKFIFPDIPKGGVDIFGCNIEFRDSLLSLKEAHTSLIGLIFWLGYRRKIIYYKRLERKIGKSSWTFTKSLRYFLDSCFSFSDLPVRTLSIVGLSGLVIAFVFGTSIVFSKIFLDKGVPGYAATSILIMFFGSLNCFGLGIIGEYVWRTYENTKARPESLIYKLIEYKANP